MAKIDFISSSIFEFRVPKNIGYAYCKILDFRYLRQMDGILANVYDLIVKESIKDITILGERDLLFGPRRLYDLPNSRGKGAWKFKGVLLSKDDNKIPDFKYSPESSPLVEDESKIKKWFISKNIIEFSYNDVYAYEQVKHLEDTVIDSTISIEIRAAMEYYRRNGLDVKKDFNLDNTANWNNYRRMNNVPIYNEIPKEIRGKAIEKL